MVVAGQHIRDGDRRRRAQPAQPAGLGGQAGPSGSGRPGSGRPRSGHPRPAGSGAVGGHLGEGGLAVRQPQPVVRDPVLAAQAPDVADVLAQEPLQPRPGVRRGRAQGAASRAASSPVRPRADASTRSKAAPYSAGVPW